MSDYTPLSLAASGGYVDIVNMLLAAGAEINSRTGSKVDQLSIEPKSSAYNVCYCKSCVKGVFQTVNVF